MSNNKQTKELTWNDVLYAIRSNGSELLGIVRASKLENVDQVVDNWTLLAIAAFLGSPDWVRELLRQKADVNACRGPSKTAIETLNLADPCCASVLELLVAAKAELPFGKKFMQRSLDWFWKKYVKGEDRTDLLLANFDRMAPIGNVWLFAEDRIWDRRPQSEPIHVSFRARYDVARRDLFASVERWLVPSLAWLVVDYSF